ncbi:MAG: sensor histidine kinase [Gallionella sp.]
MSEVAAVAIKGSGLMQSIDRVIFALPRATLIVAILTIQVLLFYGDISTGPYVPFGVFYLWSLYLAAKYTDSRATYTLAIFVTVGKAYVKYQLLPAEVQWWQFTWQFISSLTIYTTFCYLLLNQIAARKHAENVAMSAVQRAGEAERKLYSISEETQQRIGRELHDDLGQHLTGTAFMMQVLTKKLRDSGHESADAERVTQMLNQAISKTRSLSHGLSPEEIKEHGLYQMMEKFAVHVETVYSVRCVFSADKNCRMDDQEVAVHLFRITQEAVNNAIRHGHATHIDLRMSCSPYALVMEISDNGVGFDSKLVAPNAGLGLRSMRYRADLIGATLQIASRREGGTHITIQL